MRRSLMLGIELEQLDESMFWDGEVFVFGRYFPKYHYRHKDSSWSQLILKAKRHDRWIIIMLGKYVAEHLNCLLSDVKSYVLTCVPGNNRLPQMLASEIFINIHNRKKITLENLLMVTDKKRQSQHKCRSTRERLDNVSGYYGISNQVEIAGQHIVLLDDIITTEATIGECARVLENAGARSVAKIALARTVKK